MGDKEQLQTVYDNRVERLRRSEYPWLLRTTYLDHAGTTLYAKTLIHAVHQDLIANLYGNPHSESPASDNSTQRVEAARLSVLKYFNADPEHFDVVFTSNATAAIKLVADCFRDQKFWYGFHKDVHSSIVGVREVAGAGSQCFASDNEITEWINQRKENTDTSQLTLFAYPAQSNMTGYRPPLSWASQIRNASSSHGERQRTFVLLDAASYLTTGRLDLHDHEAAPDFTALSFYKIFGFPDLGALIVRKTAKEVLSHRRFFGGGTVDTVTVFDSIFHAKKTDTIHDSLEDGTLAFHSIAALGLAIPIHERLLGTVDEISDHVASLSKWLYERLSTLKHFNNTPVFLSYKDASSTYGDAKTQGPILAFSLLRSDGAYIGKSHFERLAIDCGFQLRTGGVCNPGGIASVLGLAYWELRRNYVEGARCGGDIDVVGGKPTGIIRISLGAMSTMADVRRFVEFIEFFFVEHVALPPAWARPIECENAQSTVDGIMPVENCPAITLHRPENAQAYRVWHGQWCIVQELEGKWKSLNIAGIASDLKCTLDPKNGVLRLSKDGRSDLAVNLWERPSEDLNGTNETTGKTFDIYESSHITEWLSEAVGLPCTLGRYRGEDATTMPEARTCTISTCNIVCETRSQLHAHYKNHHAAEFMKTHAFEKVHVKRDSAMSYEERIPSPTTRNRFSWPRKQPLVLFSVTQVDSVDSTASSESGGKEQKSRTKFRKRMRGLIAKILA